MRRAGVRLARGDVPAAVYLERSQFSPSAYHLLPGSSAQPLRVELYQQAAVSVAFTTKGAVPPGRNPPNPRAPLRLGRLIYNAKPAAARVRSWY